MKTKLNQLVRHGRQLGLAALLLTATLLRAQPVLTEGHTDVGIDYDVSLNEWDLHIHDEVHDVEYSPPSEALLLVKYDAHGIVPVGAQWDFLGAAGSDVWTLPKVQDPNLLFLGFGAEEIDNGVFQGDQFTMSLRAVSGPGSLVVYDTDSFGNPELLMSSRDGVDNADSVSVPAGEHRHVNWAFSEPGDYVVTFEASGVRALDSIFTTSGDVEYFFHVEAVPEPTALSLMALGGIALALKRRR